MEGSFVTCLEDESAVVSPLSPTGERGRHCRFRHTSKVGTADLHSSAVGGSFVTCLEDGSVPECVYVCMYECMYVCMYVCTYVYVCG